MGVVAYIPPEAEAQARSEPSDLTRATVMSATTEGTGSSAASVAVSHSSEGYGPSSAYSLSSTPASPTHSRGSRASGLRMKKAGPEVTLQEAVQALPEMCGDLFIPPKRVRKTGRLGAGAFATVDACDLLPWQPSATSAASPSGDSNDVQQKEQHQGATAAVDGGITRVAVKRLRPECLPDKEALKDFVMEVLVCARLDHCCIVRTLGVGAFGFSSGRLNPRKLYVVQEMMPGGTLNAVMLRQSLKPKSEVYTREQALRWAIDIARGLRYLHRSNPQVIHRDLKPDNVLLDSEDLGQAHAKLTDFGLMVIAQQQSLVASSSALSKKVLTNSFSLSSAVLLEKDVVQQQDVPGRQQNGSKTGGLDDVNADVVLRELKNGDLKMASLAPMRSDSLHSLAMERQGSKLAGLHGMLGSVPYIAPEIVHKQPYDEKCDMFSFGMLLFELFAKDLITNIMVKKGVWKNSPSFIRTAAMQVADGLRPSFPNNFPKEIRPIVESCWSQEPAKRMSAEQVYTALCGLRDSSAMPKYDSGQQLPGGKGQPSKPAGRVGGGGKQAVEGEGCGCSCAIM